MDKITHFIKNKLLGRHLDFRVRLFNVLAMAGIIVSLAAAIALSAYQRHSGHGDD